MCIDRFVLFKSIIGRHFPSVFIWCVSVTDVFFFNGMTNFVSIKDFNVSVVNSQKVQCRSLHIFPWKRVPGATCLLHYYAIQFPHGVPWGFGFESGSLRRSWWQSVRLTWGLLTSEERARCQHSGLRQWWCRMTDVHLFLCSWVNTMNSTTFCFKRHVWLTFKMCWLFLWSACIILSCCFIV